MSKRKKKKSERKASMKRMLDEIKQKDIDEGQLRHDLRLNRKRK